MPVCDQCGGPFERSRRDQRFCRTSCRLSWWRDYYKTHTHECPFCGLRHDPLFRKNAKVPALERDALVAARAQLLPEA